MTPIDAERAFAEDARTIGQWTAFRKWSADDAVIFVSQPINAREWLKDRKNPVQAIDWWPTASYISCDGKLAVNTGGWRRPDGKVGYFSTVWQHQADGSWRWISDGGDGLAKPRPVPKVPLTKVAHCSVPPSWEDDVVYVCPENAKCGHGGGTDGTITWDWQVAADGSRLFRASLWDGKRYVPVIDDKVAGSPANK
jgi:hypothetical protein